MDFRIADTFTAALARLPAQEQKAVKVSVLDLQLDPSAPGLQLHRIDKSKDPNFWSARVGRDIRLILHRTAASILICYVDHHDKAYAWAERRRIEAHPRTGAVQIVEVVERLQSEMGSMSYSIASEPSPDRLAQTDLGSTHIFFSLDDDALLGVGVPEDWIFPVRAATEHGFYDLAERLPAEAAEALLEYAVSGVLRRPVPLPDEPLPADPFEHPDARRRFVTVHDADELRAALDAPWETWSVFLHPSQRAVVDRTYGGPARVAGSAGTGKTVVALHRAARLARADAGARVLLTTFSDPLANALRRKAALLTTAASGFAPSITTLSFQGLAEDLFELAMGGRTRVASSDQVEAALVAAADAAGLKGFSQRFLVGEWTGVIDAWRVADAEAYAGVPRLGRKNRLGARQRDALWPVFADTRARLEKQGLLTRAGVFHALADHYAGRADKPFSHVVVDEAQDLGVPELRLIAAITPEGQDRLFFAGDLGQRIFQQPFSWKALGVDVRGRSATLKVNYRTSQQIREAADRLLPGVVRDVDDREEDRRGTISLFEGPIPEVAMLASEAAECDAVSRFITAALASGMKPHEVGVFVRSRGQLARAAAAVTGAGHTPLELSERDEDAGGRIAVGTMHLAKGLEFKAVAVMACDDDLLPLAERIDSVVEETDLDEVFETERHLLYVACTRARDRLFVSGVAPGSEFLADMEFPS